MSLGQEQGGRLVTGAGLGRHAGGHRAAIREVRQAGSRFNLCGSGEVDLGQGKELGRGKESGRGKQIIFSVTISNCG
jgi:hypothetical protein